MRFHMSWVVFAVLVPNLAFADRHWADNYAGGSGGGGGSTVYGVHQSFSINTKWKPLGFVPADFSVQFGDEVTQVIYMAGARYTWAPWASSDSNNPEGGMHANKVLLQALLGTVRTNDAALINDAAIKSTDNDLAFALGAGYEWVKVIKGQTMAFRGIYDRIKRSGDRDEWFNRFSAGIVYRWEPRTQ
jgi:hypothetical protein